MKKANLPKGEKSKYRTSQASLNTIWEFVRLERLDQGCNRRNENSQDREDYDETVGFVHWDRAPILYNVYVRTVPSSR